MTENDKQTDAPAPSDLYANPQDTAGGRAAAQDQERVEQGGQPVHDDETTPRPGGKAEPAK